MSLPEVFIGSKLVLKLAVFVVISSLKFANLILKQQDLVSIVLLEGLNFNSLFADVLFAGIFELPLHIMVGPSHQILEFILLFLELDLTCLFDVDKVIAPDGQNV